MIIGLVGKVSAGKDAIGAVLVQHHGFTRVSFADPLRQMAVALDPYVDVDTLGNGVRLSEWLENVGGWDAAKKHPEVRRLLQRLGTEAGRAVLGDDVWITVAMAKMTDPARHYVVTDCRFANEAVALKARGAVLWRVLRPGAGLSTTAGGAHASEVELESIQCDHTFFNDGALADLLDKVQRGLHSTERS